MPDLTITTAQLIELAPPLRALGDALFPSAKTLYAVLALIDTVEPLLGRVEKTRIALNVQFAEHDEQHDRPVVQVVDGREQYVSRDPQAFAAAWAEMLAEAVTLVGCRRLRPDELEAKDGSALVTPAQFRALRPLLDSPSPALELVS